MQQRWLVLIVALAFTACSKGGGSGAKSLPKLTAEQYDKVREVTHSQDQVVRATQLAQYEPNGTLRDPRALFIGPAESAPTPPAEDEDTRRMAERFKNCEIDSRSPDENDQSQPQIYHFKLFGDQCPAFAEFEGQTNATESSFSIIMDLSYKVLDSELYELNDITAATLSGSFESSFDQQSVEGSGEFTGQLTSQKYGPISRGTTYYVNGTQNHARLTVEVYYHFSDFTAEGTIVATSSQDGKRTVVYTVNGVPASEAEFDELFGTTISGDEVALLQ